MGRRTAEYTFSVVSVCSVVNILDAPPLCRLAGKAGPVGRGMTRGAESKKLVITRLDRVIQNNVDAPDKPTTVRFNFHVHWMAIWFGFSGGGILGMRSLSMRFRCMRLTRTRRAKMSGLLMAFWVA